MVWITTANHSMSALFLPIPARRKQHLMLISGYSEEAEAAQESRRTSTEVRPVDTGLSPLQAKYLFLNPLMLGMNRVISRCCSKVVVWR
jgi:hypothetical protein